MSYVPINFSAAVGPVVALYRDELYDPELIHRAYPVFGYAVYRDLLVSKRDNLIIPIVERQLAHYYFSSETWSDDAWSQFPSALIFDADLWNVLQGVHGGIDVVQDVSGKWVVY